MARPGYKQKCILCKEKWVLVTPRSKNPICYECQKEQLDAEIEDPEMKKLFDIPQDFYQKNSFLRSIKINYHKYGNLTEKQVAAFKKVVEDLKSVEAK